MNQEINFQRFIKITDNSGRSRYVRTEEEKKRRKAEELAKRIWKEKTCLCCKKQFIPQSQYGNERWLKTKYCSSKCKNFVHNHDPEHMSRKNEARRGNTVLHRKEYLKKIKRMGGTLWQVGTEEDRERVRERNRSRYKRLYGKENEYTLERRSNSQHHGVRRRKEINGSPLTSREVFDCKEVRIEAKRLSKDLDIELHVDHLLPLSRGGKEHPDNLLIMRQEANLFWGGRIKKCPWPRKKNWIEPQWEPQ